MLQLLESSRPYYPVLTCTVTSKTNLDSMKVQHYSNKKYWPFKYLVTGEKGGEGGEREEGGRGGGKRRGERRGKARKGKGKRAYSPQSLSLSPFPPLRHFSLVTHKILTIRSFLMTDKCHKWITLCTVFIVQIVSVTFIFLICKKSLNCTCCSIMQTD